MKTLIANIFCLLIFIGCSAPGKPLADPNPDSQQTDDSNFDPSPYDEEWPIPALTIKHDIPADLLEAENSEPGSQKVRSRNGYRVQLYVGLSQSDAREVYNEAYNWWTTVGSGITLLTDESDIAAHHLQDQVPVYLDYEQPNYKVRLGNFISRDEAKEFSTHLEGSFDSYFIAPSRILR